MVKVCQVYVSCMWHTSTYAYREVFWFHGKSSATPSQSIWDSGVPTSRSGQGGSSNSSLATVPYMLSKPGLTSRIQLTARLRLWNICVLVKRSGHPDSGTQLWVGGRRAEQPNSNSTSEPMGATAKPTSWNQTWRQTSKWLVDRRQAGNGATIRLACKFCRQRASCAASLKTVFSTCHCQYWC